MSFIPVYLPRDFGQLFYIAVYVHPNADGDRAATTIAGIIEEAKSIDRNAPCFILGDINKKTAPHIKKVLPRFQQYVSTATRKTAI